MKDSSHQFHLMLSLIKVQNFIGSALHVINSLSPDLALRCINLGGILVDASIEAGRIASDLREEPVSEEGL